MAKKEPSHHKEGDRTSFTFPRLHRAVADAVSDQLPSVWLNENYRTRKLDEYSTHVVARFFCNNNTCPKTSWSSGNVAIVIRQYPNNGYNATVFNQRCKTCERLGHLRLDEESYVERVAYRLKVWAGVSVQRPDYVAKETPPHEMELCEGCKRGVCRESGFW